LVCINTYIRYEPEIRHELTKLNNQFNLKINRSFNMPRFCITGDIKKVYGPKWVRNNVMDEAEKRGFYFTNDVKRADFLVSTPQLAGRGETNKLDVAHELGKEIIDAKEFRQRLEDALYNKVAPEVLELRRKYGDSLNFIGASINIVFNKM
jgi:NAD-dependent DNA ligase